MHSIKTPEDWWEVLNKNWDNIYNIFWMVFPMDKPVPKDLYELTNKNNPIVADSFQIDILRAKNDKDYDDLLKYLSAAWDFLPDRPDTREIDGFFILCDLCSEAWVFEKEEE